MKKIKKLNYRKSILNYTRKLNKKEKMLNKQEKIKLNKLCQDMLTLQLKIKRTKHNQKMT